LLVLAGGVCFCLDGALLPDACLHPRLVGVAILRPSNSINMGGRFESGTYAVGFLSYVYFVLLPVGA
jgi:hypothetical protein